MANDEPKCAFCGRSRSDVGILIIGPDGANICDECAKLCVEMTESSSAKRNPHASEMTPAKVAQTAARVTVDKKPDPDEIQAIELKKMLMKERKVVVEMLQL